MGDVMLLGVLGIPRPDDPKELSQLDWLQLKDRIKEARERIVSDADALTSLQERPEKAEALVYELVEAGEQLVSFGCPVCHGDCVSANPPVQLCPMQAIRAAIEKAKKEIGG